MNHPEDCLTLKQSVDMKTILLFLLLCISLSTSAQTADERAGTYMNQADWFSLQREFAINKTPYILSCKNSVRHYWIISSTALKRPANP